MAISKGLSVAIVGFLVLTMGVLGAESPARADSTLKADPEVVELAPGALAAAKLIGSGFKAEDRVLIILKGADQGKDVPVATTEADASGSFEAKMDMMSILQGIFHLKFVAGKPTPDPNNPPLPPGIYSLKARSWDSGLEAVCNFEITAPKKK
jgi:hypothetical protein